MTVATEAFQLEPFLDSERCKVDAALEKALARLPDLPVPREFVGAISHGVMAGGKRIRPILCVASFRAIYGRPMVSALEDSLYDLAASLELIHAYSLMHDDLPCMDDASLRRGSPTPHTIYGESVIMRAGILLIPLAGLRAWTALASMGVTPQRAASILCALCQAAGHEGMVGGQALDLLAEGRELSRVQLLELHRRKTGALLTASARIGVMAAGAVSEVERAFARYGEAIGLAFQITDDVLDVTGSAQGLGKNPSDQNRGKSTFVGLLGVEEARREAAGLVAGALIELRGAGIVSESLETLAWHVVHRER